MATKTTHTPGPWSVGPFQGIGRFKPKGRSLYIHHGESEVMIGRLIGVTDDDARLIAAAPDLLAALVAVNADFDAQAHGRKAPDYLKHWNEARAAIARAEGR